MWVDGYSIGKLFQSTRASVLVLGVTISTPSTGGSTAIFVDAPPAGVDGRGESEARTIQGALQRAPWDLTAQALRARLAIAIGDGHYVDGEASNYNPTDAFQRLFHDAFFCSNALIALARSLCKCLLAVLITASEADAVTGFLVRGASQYDNISRREKKNTATKPTQASNKTTQKQNKGKQKHHKNQNLTKWNDISKSNDET